MACALAAASGSPASGADAGDASWISDQNGVLELLLAHQERFAPDLGVLQIDPTRRAVLWEGYGERACPHRIEATFDDVKTVRTRRGGSFVVELRGQRDDALILIPVANRAWLTAQYTVAPRLDRLLENSETFPERGTSRASGSPGGGAAAMPAPVDVPATVTADARKAVELIRDAMGRAPTPAVLLREALHGKPVDASVPELLEEPAAYAGRAVRLQGRLEPSAGAPGEYRLLDEDVTVAAVPERDIAVLVQAQLPAQGAQVEITGVYRPGDGQAVVGFWEFAVLEGAAAGPTEGQPTTLEALASDPQAAKVRTVCVAGKFRGRNLYGDLPATSQRTPGDWVIKDGRAAAWVTGMKPAGAGWALDPGSREDGGYWVEVVGRPTVSKGLVYLRARQVSVIPPPRGAHIEPARRIVVAGDVAPAVIFTLPLEGEPVRPDSRFVVQFNKYMDESTLANRVRLSYPAAPPAEERDVPIRTRYDEERRALIVDALESLHHGRAIELRLLPGILDVNGLPLAPRAGTDPPGAVAVIRYSVE